MAASADRALPDRASVVVIGAGPAGLAVGATLKERGIEALLVDGADAVGSSFRGHYDRLHLHTVRWLSGLPGYPMQRRFGSWVSRDDFIRYLEEYAEHHGLRPELGTRVEAIVRHAGRWLVTTTRGAVAADEVVVATGANRVPYLPPALALYQGELMHSSAYRTGATFRGMDVLVVGAGNSGAEIAADLSEHGAFRVRIAVRTPPNLLLRDVGGLPLQATAFLMRPLPVRLADRMVAMLRDLAFGDLTRYGLAPPLRGAVSEVLVDHAIPIIDVGFVGELKRGQIEPVPAVVGAEGHEVILADGSQIRPHRVIAATGFRAGLHDLVGHLGVLRPNGRPLVHGAEVHPGAPHLRFIGFTTPLTGVLFAIAGDARAIARAIGRK